LETFKIRKILSNNVGQVKGLDYLINIYKKKALLEIDKRQFIECTDNILKHKFSIFDSQAIDFGEKIEWTKDYNSGYSWDNKYYRKLNYANLSNGIDVKFPWEISRFQHVTSLGYSYQITKNIKYYEEFKIQVTDWIKNNPYEKSVNWINAMEVGIRASNWILGIEFFRDLILNDSKFLKELNYSLYEHGSYIFNNLEKQDCSTNHYVADLLGLMVIGLYFRSVNLNFAIRWIELSIGELESEIKLQVNSDGTDYEASTYYHCFVTEMFLYTQIIANENDIRTSKLFYETLSKMVIFISCISDEKYRIPIIGDMDNGRFFKFNYFSNDYNNFSDLIMIYNEIDRRNLIINRYNCPRTIHSIKELREAVEVNEFPQGGYYIYKTQKIKSIIKCGKNGLNGEGGHTHNDSLSIILSLFQLDFFVDPGSPVYTSDPCIRNEYRSTYKHNTLSIEKYEQNEFYEYNLFKVKNQNKAELIQLSNNEFEGKCHLNYNSNTSIKHTRKVRFYTDSIVILDETDDTDNLKKCIYFYLHPNVEVLETDENSISLINSNVIICLKSKNNNYEIFDYYYSPSYGAFVESKAIRYKVFNNINEIEISL
jgi:hypothetical protein